ncbi:WD40 repeat-like protein [Martensiomyces pterosporus]|nr:WD40 repeat-like protein [Martensiomyces pterosporus]
MFDPTDEGFDDYPTSAASSPSSKRAPTAHGTQTAASRSPTDEKRILESLLHALESSMSPETRAQLAVLLLSNVSGDILKLAARQLDLLLHRDFIGALPVEISTRILAYLSPRDIAASVSLVNRQWYAAASQPALWHTLFIKQGWHFDMERWMLYNSFPEGAVPHRSSPLVCPRSNGTAAFSKSQAAPQSPQSPVWRPTPAAPLLFGSSDSAVLGYGQGSSSSSSSNSSSSGSGSAPSRPHFAASPAGDAALQPGANPNLSATTSISSLGTLLTAAAAAASSSFSTGPHGANKSDADGNGGRTWKFAKQRQWQQQQQQQQHIAGHQRYMTYPAPGTNASTHWAKSHSRKASDGGTSFFRAASFSQGLVSQSTRSIDWRQLYIDRHQLSENWRYGKCRIDRWESAHSESIYCLQFDKQNRLFTGSRDHTVKMWHLSDTTNEILPMATLSGHSGSVLTLQADGDTLITGSSDATACVWDLRTRTVTHRLHHQDSVLSLRFNDRWLATASKDRIVRVWRRDDGYATAFRLLGHHVAINAVQLCGDMLVSASGDRTIKVWDLCTRTCVLTFLDHTRGVACLDFDGKYIVSGSSDRSIRVWNVATGLCERTILNAHSDLVRTIMFDRSMDILVSGSYDESVKIWSFSTGALMHKIKGVHTSRVFKLMFDQSRIISCSHDRSVSVVDFASGIPSARLFC